MIQSTRWLISQYNTVMVFVLIFPLIYSFPKRSDSDLLQSRDLRSQKIRTCGRNLMDLIQLVCSGSLPGKRSYHDENWAIRDNTAWSQDTQFNKLNFEENDSDTSNFMEPKAAFSLFGLNKRSQNEDSQVFFRSLRGATDECCYKSCTMNQLRAYCRPLADDLENITKIIYIYSIISYHWL